MSRTAAQGPLAGRGIVVTRPREQAAGLAALIESGGGRALVFPSIEIADIADLGPLFAILDALESYQFAIFISPNAVQRALNLLHARRPDFAWPATLRVAAIGRGSRRELERRGLTAVIAPAAHADSEALLEIPEFADPRGARVVIFRGDGGRERLRDELVRRGAHVEYAECYRRMRPRADTAPLLSAWARGGVHAVTVSSAEGLVNLFELLGGLGQQWLRDTPLFVPHERVAAEARRLGVREVILAGPSDGEMHARLMAYFDAGTGDNRRK